MSYYNSEKNKPVIYCGPSFKGIAEQFQTFTQISDTLKEHINKCPSISALLVPMDKFMHTRNSINRRGTVEYIHNSKILEYQKELAE